MAKLTSRHSDLTKDREYYYLYLLEKVIGRGGGSADLEGTGYYILLYDVSAGQIEEYPFTEAGLNEALAASSNGDRVWIPPGTITLTAGITVPAGVTMQGASKEGTKLVHDGTVPILVTSGINSHLDNLTVDHTSNAYAAGYAIYGVRTKLSNLSVSITNTYSAGSNRAATVAARVNDIYYEVGKTVISIENCEFYAYSDWETNLYALYSDLDIGNCICYIKNISCKVIGTYNYTDMWAAVDINSTATSRVIIDGLNLDISSTGLYSTVMGIYLDSYCTLLNTIVNITQSHYGCFGIMTGGSNNIIRNTHVKINHAGNDWDDYAWAIEANGGVEMYDSSFVANGGSGDPFSIGITQDDLNYAYNCVFFGDDYDIEVYPNDTLSVYACQYDPTKVLLWSGASVVQLPGSGTGTEQSTSSFSDPPLASELTAVFGSPEDLGAGRIFSIDIDGDGTAVYIAVTTDVSWFIKTMIKAQDFISKTDAITIGESVLVYLGGWSVSKTDNITIGESVLVYTGGWSVSESDTVTIGEIVTVQIPFTGGFPVLESDVVVVSDIVTVSII